MTTLNLDTMKERLGYTLDDALEALKLYAAKKGKDWVLDLIEDWRTERDVNALPDPYGPALRWVRNNLGPKWLLKTYRKKGTY